MRSNLITILLLALVCVSFGKSYGKKRTILRLKRESVGPDLESLLQQDSEHWKDWLRGLLFSDADLEEISTILVNHRMDLTSLLSLNSVSDLVNIGIKLGDAQRIWDKAHEGTTTTVSSSENVANHTTEATAAAQPVVVNIQISVPTLTNNTANATTTENTENTETTENTATSEKTVSKRKRNLRKLKRDASALISFLNGTVTNSDLSVIAAILDAHRLTVADLSNVTAEELVKIGIALNDATKIVGKAQTSSANSPSQNQDVATPIDSDWLSDVVVEPSDILTILPILKAHRILTVDDLKLITADDLINIGIALGDAKRIVARVNNETESATAPAVNVDATEEATEETTTNTTQTPQTIIVQVTLNAADLTNNATATATTEATTEATETATKRKRFIMEDKKEDKKVGRRGRGRGNRGNRGSRRSGEIKGSRGNRKGRELLEKYIKKAISKKEEARRRRR